MTLTSISIIIAALFILAAWVAFLYYRFRVRKLEVADQADARIDQGAQQTIYELCTALNLSKRRLLTPNTPDNPGIQPVVIETNIWTDEEIERLKKVILENLPPVD